MWRSVPAVVLVLLALGSCTGEVTPETTITAPTRTSTSSSLASGPKRVIVDYSPTVSDVGGLLYLLSHPDFEVVAISLPVTGEAGCELGLEVTLGLLSMIDRQGVPVACDPREPDEFNPWPEAFLQGQENLAFGLTTPEGNTYSGTAPELIAETISASGSPVVIWAVGPLTNVARAFEIDPRVTEKVERVVIMGGALDVPGNVFDSAAEWNFYVDAEAAQSVLQSGAPITLVPLDATNHVPVPAWYPLSLQRVPETDQIVYLDRMVQLFPSVTSGFYYFWDELAAMVLTGDIEVSTETVGLTVVTENGDVGQILRDTSGSAVLMVNGVPDPNSFYREFVSLLSGSPFQTPTATNEEREYFEAVEQSLEGLAEALERFNPGGSFDRESAVSAVDRLFTALSESLPIVEDLEPPPGLERIHDGYIEELRALVSARDAVLGDISLAESWDEAFQAFGVFEDNDACLTMQGEANYRGVEIDLLCVG